MRFFKLHWKTLHNMIHIPKVGNIFTELPREKESIKHLAHLRVELPPCYASYLVAALHAGGITDAAGALFKGATCPCDPAILDDAS